MSRNKKLCPALLCSLAGILCLAGSSLHAQDWRGEKGGMSGGPGAPPMERSFHGMEHGRWWNNPRIAEQIGLTDDQKKKMDEISQQHRLQIIDLDAALEKQEAIMQPLVSADQPDEAKILSQIDAIAQARAELEKNRARMLFSIRQVLTADQWKKLQTIAHEGPPRMDGAREGGRGWNRGSRGTDGAMPRGPQEPSGQPNAAPPPPNE